MPVDTGLLNYLSRTFQAPDPAQIDESRSRNALLKEQVATAPLRRQSAELGIQADRQALSENQRKSAQGWLANSLGAVAQSPTPLKHAHMLMRNPNFQGAWKLLGYPPTGITPQDTDESVRNEARTLARAFGAQQPERFVDEAGPGGSKLQRNLETNQLSQVVPREPQQPQGPRDVPLGYRRAANGNLEYEPGGPADPKVAASNKNLRPIPASSSKGIIANRLAIAQIDRAITAAKAYPDAFGYKNYLGDAWRQRSDSQGVPARAQVADIGSLKIHDRSGAAVTAAEQPRLQPFIPTATDNPDVVVDKLMNLRANLEAELDATESFFAEDSGYRPLPERASTGPTRISNDAEYNALPSGAQYIAPDGSTRTKR